VVWLVLRRVKRQGQEGVSSQQLLLLPLLLLLLLLLLLGRVNGLIHSLRRS